MENYMGEQRIRYQAFKVQSRAGPMGPRLLLNENRALLDRLGLYSAMPSKDKSKMTGMYDDQTAADGNWNPFGSSGGGDKLSYM